MTQRKWHPADGAEQTDSSLEAAQERISTGFWTAENRSDEPELGFDATYADWRAANGNQQDDAYRQWRRDTGQTFSEAFLDWVRAPS